MSRIFVDLSKESGGMGDNITLIPTMRALKRKYPDKDLVVITKFHNIKIFSYCDYVDYIIPVDLFEEHWRIGANFIHEDMVFSLNTYFITHHNDHIVKTRIKEIAKINPENEPLEFELSIKDYDIPIIEEHKKQLLKLANGKPIVGINPGVTAYARMYPQAHWQKLANILRDNGYFVVSLGHDSDLHIDVDFDSMGKYAAHQIPKILDVFEAIFVISSGILQLASINQDIHIVLINAGQFPAKIFAPYRHGKLGYNITIIGHNCPVFDKCFKEHIAGHNAHIKQCQDFIEQWEKCAGREFPVEEVEIPSTYTSWVYCGKENNKFVCSNLDPELIFQAFKNKNSTTISVPSHGLSVFHGNTKNVVEDYSKWKDTIKSLKTESVIYVNIIDADTSNICEKMRCVNVLYPNHTLVVIGKKKDVLILKNCRYVHCVLPVELISKSLKLRYKDILLKI